MKVLLLTLWMVCGWCIPATATDNAEIEDSMHSDLMELAEVLSFSESKTIAISHHLFAQIRMKRTPILIFSKVAENEVPKEKDKLKTTLRPFVMRI